MLDASCPPSFDKPAVTYAADGVLCPVELEPDGGCPAAAPGTCLVHAGDVACPTSTPTMTRHVIGKRAELLDERTCGCACHVTSCNNPALTLYNDTQCTQAATKVPFGSSCAFVSSIALVKAYRFTADPVCAPVAPTAPVGGALAFGAPRTLCCYP